MKKIYPAPAEYIFFVQFQLLKSFIRQKAKQRLPKGRNRTMAKVQHPEPDIREIYASYYNRMLSWAARYFPEMADREDAVHEAFVRLLKRPELIRDAGSGARLEGLCRIVLRSACLDLLKKQREVPVDEEFFADAGTDREEQPDERAAEKDALERAVAQLPEATRDMLTLAYLYGYTPAEIAKLVGKKEWAVRKTLQRGKKSLYDLLKEEES